MDMELTTPASRRWRLAAPVLSPTPHGCRAGNLPAAARIAGIIPFGDLQLHTVANIAIGSQLTLQSDAWTALHKSAMSVISQFLRLAVLAPPPNAGGRPALASTAPTIQTRV